MMKTLYSMGSLKRPTNDSTPTRPIEKLEGLHLVSGSKLKLPLPVFNPRATSAIAFANIFSPNEINGIDSCPNDAFRKSSAMSWPAISCIIRGPSMRWRARLLQTFMISMDASGTGQAGALPSVAAAAAATAL